MAHDLLDVRVRVFQVPKAVQFDVATIGDAIGQHRRSSILNASWRRRKLGDLGGVEGCDCSRDRALEAAGRAMDPSARATHDVQSNMSCRIRAIIQCTMHGLHPAAELTRAMFV